MYTSDYVKTSNYVNVILCVTLPYKNTANYNKKVTKSELKVKVINRNRNKFVFRFICNIALIVGRRHLKIQTHNFPDNILYFDLALEH